ncbi:O-methyltransferase [Bacillaceae bacterium]
MIVSETIVDYLSRFVPERTPLLQRLEREAQEEKIPIVDLQTIRLIRMLLLAHRPCRILEIGTAIGYSTIWLADAAPHARITTIEINHENINRALANFAEAGVRDRIEIIEGDAGEGLPDHYSFDFIFIDAGKMEYRKYVELYLPHLKPGGLIVCDNVLFKGLVVGEASDNERVRAMADSVKMFNEYLAAHPELETCFVPIGDGLSISIRKETRGSGVSGVGE